jgi:hypothetical protein
LRTGKNIDIRKSFHQLFIHFFGLPLRKCVLENNCKSTSQSNPNKGIPFWQTLSYLAPIRLYIFISFITFFLIGVFRIKKLQLFDVNSKDIRDSKLQEKNLKK